MPLIDVTYFKGSITLGNVSTGSDAQADTDLIDVYIPQYETEYLKKVLGYPLYTAFMAGLLITPTIPQKWVDLRDGVDYTVHDKPYRWNGFKNTDKVSPIAFYVYAEYQNNYATTTTNIAEVMNQVQNSTNTSPMNKIWAAWNDMKELNCSLYHYLNNHTDVYTEYDRSRVACFGSRNPFGI